MKLTDKELLTQLAKRVKQLRKDKGVTQQEAFNDCNIHFGRIEQGIRDISFTTLYKLCNYFQIELNEFFTEDFRC